MKLTIAIPTHNRAGMLAETLAGVRSLLLRGISAECIVVDNNSTDETAEVVAAQSALMPMPLRRVVEPRQGSSFARNRALYEASGDFICFLDNDTIPEPQWAGALLGAIERRALDAACGLVLARWLAPPPNWLGPVLYSKLAIHDPARIGHEASPDRLANYFSANVGIRRNAFERFGAFREDLGVVGQNPMSGEDTELFARLMKGGGRMGFVSDAVVHHLIGPERMTRAYFRHKSFAFGAGSARAGGRSHNRPGKLAKNLIRMARAALRRDQAAAFYYQLECVNFLGYWRERLSGS